MGRLNDASDKYEHLASRGFEAFKEAEKYEKRLKEMYRIAGDSHKQYYDELFAYTTEEAQEPEAKINCMLLAETITNIIIKRCQINYGKDTPVDREIPNNCLINPKYRTRDKSRLKRNFEQKINNYTDILYDVINRLEKIGVEEEFVLALANQYKFLPKVVKEAWNWEYKTKSQRAEEKEMEEFRAEKERLRVEQEKKEYLEKVNAYVASLPEEVVADKLTKQPNKNKAYTELYETSLRQQAKKEKEVELQKKEQADAEKEAKKLAYRKNFVATEPLEALARYLLDKKSKTASYATAAKAVGMTADNCEYLAEVVKSPWSLADRQKNTFYCGENSAKIIREFMEEYK